MSNNIAPVTTKPTGVEYAAQMTNWVRNVPARINDSTVAVVQKAKDGFGDFGAAAITAVPFSAAGLYMGGIGAKATSLFVSAGASGDAITCAAAMGFCAAAAPAIAGWIHSLSKDGAARGVLEGAGITAAYFGGHAIAASLDWGTFAGNWTGLALGVFASVGYIAGLVKRHG